MKLAARSPARAARRDAPLLAESRLAAIAVEKLVAVESLLLTKVYPPGMKGDCDVADGVLDDVDDMLLLLVVDEVEVGTEDDEDDEDDEDNEDDEDDAGALPKSVTAP